ncbi:protein-disulfide reductase DsbD family protein [Photobacterium leiognathi]|uniref:protein-disulfide reductase DsbD family protein n=1 Tax=Photobacterium leiognathi TaxID=553611 RepID=UPI0027356377|nr:protein-disulfide reductase DsbD domain-containing protein [Photobacterium leiognathi]
MRKFNTLLHMAALLCIVFGSTLSLNTHAAGLDTALSTGWMTDQTHPYIKTNFVITGQVDKQTKTVAAYLEVELDEGWHTYWRSPGEGGIAPKMTWDNSTNLHHVDWFWSFPEHFSLLNINTLGYKRHITFPMVLHVEELSKPVALNATLTISSCTSICVLTDFPIKISFVPNDLISNDKAMLTYARAMSKVPKDSPLIENVKAKWDKTQSKLIITANHQIGWTHPDVLVDGKSDQIQDATFSKPDIDIKGQTLTATFSVSSWMDEPNLLNENIFLSFKDGSFIAEKAALVTAGQAIHKPIAHMMLLALVGGLILNVMPCVFPVLGMKLGSVIEARGLEKRQIRFQFLASSTGILLSFWLITLCLMLLKVTGSAIGWGIQFQNGWFLGAMFIITALFGANMLGLFEIRLSSNTNTWMASKGDNSYFGHIIQGMFATLLATPCSAPFLGTAVAFALATDIPTMFVIFTALAIGMALPWILVSIFPSIALALPKPGIWMNKVKYLFGAMMLMTSIWLLSLLKSHLSEVWLYIASVMVFGAMLIRVWQVHGYRQAVILGSIIIGLTIGASFLNQRESKLLPPEPAWKALSTQAINDYVSAGNVVFVDLTADWCVTCKANKLGVLLREPVYSTLLSDNIVPMRGDWTVPSKKVTTFLQDHGRFGVPFNIVYGPNAPAGIELPVILTEDAVLNAIKKAGGQ